MKWKTLAFRIHVPITCGGTLYGPKEINGTLIWVVLVQSMVPIIGCLMTWLCILAEKTFLKNKKGNDVIYKWEENFPIKKEVKNE